MSLRGAMEADGVSSRSSIHQAGRSRDFESDPLHHTPSGIFGAQLPSSSFHAGGSRSSSTHGSISESGGNQSANPMSGYQSGRFTSSRGFASSTTASPLSANPYPVSLAAPSVGHNFSSSGTGFDNLQPPSPGISELGDPSTSAPPMFSASDASVNGFNLGFTPGGTTSSAPSSPVAEAAEPFIRPRGRAPPGRSSFHSRLLGEPSPGPMPRTPFQSPFPPPRATPRSTASRAGTAGKNIPTPSSTNRSRHNENVIAALVHGRGFASRDIGLAAINLTSCELHLCQLSDTHAYIRTVAKMNVFRPTQVLMPDTALATGSFSSSLVQCIQRFDNDMAITSVGRNAFSDTNGIQYIRKLAVVDHLNILHVVEQKYYALAATGALMAHVEDVLNTSFAPGTLRVYFRGTDETVLIDSETSHRLELVGSLNPAGGPSLLSALNFCQTAAGSRLLRSNILEPLTNREAIHQRLDAVEELVTRPTDVHQPIKDILARFVDVERAVSQCIVVPKKPNLSFIEHRLNAVVALKHILTLVPPLRHALSKATSTLISDLAQELSRSTYEDLLAKIRRVVDDRTRVVKGKVGMQRQRFSAIKTGVSQMLDVCRQSFVELEAEIEEYVEDLAGKYQVPLVLANTAARGYHLQQPIRGIKGTLAPDIRLPPIFICVKRQGNCVAFTTQHLLVANERIKSVQKDVEKITNVIVEELLASIREDIRTLYKLKEMICHLDVLVSFAQAAFGGGFCRPVFGHEMIIRNGRHPILNRFTPKVLVSNDTEMSEECNFLVITGANMSGKSTYIRQVMLLQIVAQIGCFVPASSASFRIVDQLFSRLATHDRIETNASSFALEMMEINYIVRNAGPNSLVILDELGKTTSADHGSAICWTVCEALILARAWVLVTTHITLITKLQDVYFNVTNYHMETVEEERQGGRLVLNYTHRILPGVTQLENYGLKLAAMAAFPPEVIARAKGLVPVLSSTFKPLPKAPLDMKMDRLDFKLHRSLVDIGRRMSSMSDRELLQEVDRVRSDYKEELNVILAEED